MFSAVAWSVVDDWRCEHLASYIFDKIYHAIAHLLPFYLDGNDYAFPVAVTAVTVEADIKLTILRSVNAHS